MSIITHSYVEFVPKTRAWRESLFGLVLVKNMFHFHLIVKYPNAGDSWECALMEICHLPFAKWIQFLCKEHPCKKYIAVILFTYEEPSCALRCVEAWVRKK